MPDSSTSQRDFALRVVHKLREAGHQALWAGGCVRDQLLGLPPKDYDVATSAHPEEVRQLFGRHRTLAIGAAFGVISIRGGQLTPIEVATFRSDGQYVDGRRPESVRFTTAEEDAQRRDFTINGLFFDPLTSEVVDYVGGVADLKARVVRAIGDPRQRFAEDKLRMLRAVRFAAAFDFALDDPTLAAVQSMAGEVTQVSGERIGAELRRILTHASRPRGTALLAESGLLEHVLPEVWPHAKVQNLAWRNSLARLERLAEPSVALALAAWLFGLVDRRQVRDLGRRVRLSNKELDRAGWLLECAPAMLGAATLAWPQLQRLLTHEGAAELVQLAASALPVDDRGLARCRDYLARPAEQWNPPPLVTGDDLVARGFEPGPHFARLLEHLRDEQLEGRLTTVEEALLAARSWIDASAASRRR